MRHLLHIFLLTLMLVLGVQDKACSAGHLYTGSRAVEKHAACTGKQQQQRDRMHAVKPYAHTGHMAMPGEGVVMPHFSAMERGLPNARMRHNTSRIPVPSPAFSSFVNHACIHLCGRITIARSRFRAVVSAYNYVYTLRHLLC